MKPELKPKEERIFRGRVSVPKKSREQPSKSMDLGVGGPTVFPKSIFAQFRTSLFTENHKIELDKLKATMNKKK